jgi:hypothetical protein
MRNEIWHDHQISLNTINKNIQRLRETLAVIPGLSINIRRGEGCQLIIQSKL